MARLRMMPTAGRLKGATAFRHALPLCRPASMAPGSCRQIAVAAPLSWCGTSGYRCGEWGRGRPRFRPAACLRRQANLTLCASVWPSHQSVGPSNFDARQVPRTSERRGHEVESRSNLGPSRRPGRRTGALSWVPGPRLEAPAAVGGTASVKDFVRRRTAHGRVRPDLVVPALDPLKGCAEGTVLERDEFGCQPLFLESADEPLLDGDAAMPANGAEPGTNLVVLAPFAVLLAELAALVADRVLGHP
jgi:hypothetical protein